MTPTTTPLHQRLVVVPTSRLLSPDERVLVNYHRHERTLVAYLVHRKGYARIATGRLRDDGHVTVTMEDGRGLVAYAGEREPQVVACHLIADHLIARRSRP